jgi:hypothetical protein
MHTTYEKRLKKIVPGYNLNRSQIKERQNLLNKIRITSDIIGLEMVDKLLTQDLLHLLLSRASFVIVRPI